MLQNQIEGSDPVVRPVLESRSEALRLVFAANLRQRMLEKRMSQSDLARAVWQENRTDSRGYEQPMGKDRISAYYNGRVMPTSANLAKIAVALDTTPEQLLQGGSFEPPQIAAALGKAMQSDFRITMDPNDSLTVLIEVKLRAPREAGPEFMALVAKYMNAAKQE